MPLNKLTDAQLDLRSAQSLMTALQTVLRELNGIGHNLTPEERTKYGSINERNKLIIGKAFDYHTQQPDLQTPDIDWARFDASWLTRSNLAAIETLCDSIKEVASDTRILHDYDLYQMTLTDYDYTKYKAGSTDVAGGYTTKFEELKQFFGNPTGINSSDPATPATEQPPVK